MQLFFIGKRICAFEFSTRMYVLEGKILKNCQGYGPVSGSTSLKVTKLL